MLQKNPEKATERGIIPEINKEKVKKGLDEKKQGGSRQNVEKRE